MFTLEFVSPLFTLRYAMPSLDPLLALPPTYTTQPEYTSPVHPALRGPVQDGWPDGHSAVRLVSTLCIYPCGSGLCSPSPIRPRFARTRFIVRRLRGSLRALRHLRFLRTLRSLRTHAFHCATCVMPRGDPRSSRRNTGARSSRSETPSHRGTRCERRHRRTRHGSPCRRCHNSSQADT